MFQRNRESDFTRNLCFTKDPIWSPAQVTHHPEKDIRNAAGFTQINVVTVFSG